MRIDIAATPKLVSGETLLNLRDHRIDAGLAVTLHQGIEVVGAFGPRLRDQTATACGVRFIPDGKIAIDHVGVTAHMRLHAEHRFKGLRCRPAS
jgi:hypothetical protein